MPENTSGSDPAAPETFLVARERQGFPSRIAPHRAETSGISDTINERAVTEAPTDPATASVLFRHVAGIDERPKAMSADELACLGDPFGLLLRSGMPFPLSLRQTLARVDGLVDDAALPAQLVFLVADGGHVPWSEETQFLKRAFRFAVARGNGAFPVLISASTMIDSEEDEAFLQIIGWDEQAKVFHFYQRLQRTYFWAGMSTHALQSPSRGKGPFDSHVNGSMVMKELRAPWAHWHAPLAGINDEALAPDDPLRDDPLFRSRVTAERMETEVVRPGIRRWNRARVDRIRASSSDWRPIDCLRQIVGESTVNLATSETASGTMAPGRVFRPPLSFFVNRDVLFDALDLVPDGMDVADIAIRAEHWLDCVSRYDVHRSDGLVRVPGEGTFVFMTPEAAFEDTDLVSAMIDADLLSRRFAISLAMVDFCNPVFSDRRSSLLGHVPDRVRGPALRQALEDAFVASVRNSPGKPGSAELEFLRWWDEQDLDKVATAAIEKYFEALRSVVTDAARVDDWFRIAEFRRRRFRKRPLNEFALTTPRTNIPDDAPPMTMGMDGRGQEPV